MLWRNMFKCSCLCCWTNWSVFWFPNWYMMPTISDYLVCFLFGFLYVTYFVIDMYMLQFFSCYKSLKAFFVILGRVLYVMQFTFSDKVVLYHNLFWWQGAPLSSVRLNLLLYTLILSCIWLSTVCLKQVILWLGLLVFFISDTLDLRFEIIGNRFW